MRFPTCRETSELLSQKQDRALGWRERVALRLHLVACAACRRFARQLDLMRLSVKRMLERNDNIRPGPGS